MKNSVTPQNAESANPRTPALLHPAFRILVVDDDVDIRQFSARLLNGFGHQAETAEDGASAWEALLATSYDLLITDNNMPTISGLELLKKLRAARMALPVIMASGALPTRELERSAWLQPVATLAKPFTGDQLLETVSQFLAPPKKQ